MNLDHIPNKLNKIWILFLSEVNTNYWFKPKQFTLDLENMFKKYACGRLWMEKLKLMLQAEQSKAKVGKDFKDW